MDIQNQKAELRTEVLAKRRGMTPLAREEASAEVARQFLASAEYQNANSIGFYASLPDEVATDGLIEQALTAGKIVALPVVRAQGTGSSGQLIWCEIKSLADLESGFAGIREPACQQPGCKADCPEIEIGQLDLLVVPGVAFDAAGNRLGYGKGFYDQSLKDFAGVSVGLAFCRQIVSKVPTNEFDQAVQKVLVN
jgi:5-formyltetrahydrofolate cyclo-ligase